MTGEAVVRVSMFQPRSLMVTAVLAAPMLVFVYLRLNPSLDTKWGAGAPHFYIVSLAAGIALLLAFAVLRASITLPDHRTTFLALAFLAMSTIFLAHGAGTAPWFGGHVHEDPFAAYGSGEGVSTDHTNHGATATASPSTISPSPAPANDGKADARNMVVGYSARLSLLVGAVFLALSVVEFSMKAAERITRHSTLIILGASGVFALHITTALVEPRLISWIPLSSNWMSWSVAVVTWGCLAFAGLRYFQAYRLAMLPLPGTVALGIALLAEAQLMMMLGPAWRLSWWTYHAVMLIGFAGPMLAMLHQYQRAGDLGSLVEGMFLRQQVQGIRAGDPQTLTILGAAVAGKDGETAGHLERVGELSVAVGRRMGLPAERLPILRWGGRLHDLGKIGVPNNILRKPGKLTDDEFAIMKLHTVRGHQVALRCGALAEAAPIIRSHHEKLDGTGYPDGLVGDQIPLEARIVAVCDVWDALVYERPYKKAWLPEAAAALLRRDSGKHFDPACVDAILAEVGMAETPEAARKAA